ncbi:MAG: glycosyltransferase family 4 protein [Xanthomonadales bacterium]|nr:glycosyltransferase family 4 protein [Xanthomonadales bacterium]
MSGKLIFINRYFHPDHSATSQMLSDLAFGLARSGRQVEVICSRQLYDDPGVRLSPGEGIRGVRVWRAGGTRFGRSGPGRLLDYLTFLLAAAWLLLRRAGRGDRVIFKTDPPMMSAFLWPIAALRGAVVYNWLQDLFPEVAVSLGVLPAGPARPLRWFRDLGLRRARCNVAICESMAARLLRRGLDEQRITTIENWCDVEALSRQDGDDLRRQWGLGDALVVGYSGNLGRAHPIEALQHAIGHFRDDARLRFLFVGGGHGYQLLRRWAEENQLSNVVFKAYQPRSILGISLAVPDIHLVTLDQRLEGQIFPSKFYGVAAAGRACLFVGDVNGELARRIRTERLGVSVPDGAALVACLDELLADRSEIEQYGRNARAHARLRCDISRALNQWDALLSR